MAKHYFTIVAEKDAFRQTIYLDNGDIVDLVVVPPPKNVLRNGEAMSIDLITIDADRLPHRTVDARLGDSNARHMRG